MHVFITYGDTGYEASKERIIKEAYDTHEFDVLYSYGREDISDELRDSNIINIKRGGGLWSWKPDVILSTMKKHQIGDIVVYCDAGCSLYPSSEWKKYWSSLQKYDIIAQRMYHQTYKWTRKEIIDFFSSNLPNWENQFQFMATILLRISEFSLAFVKEWRDIMINHPNLAMDVEESELDLQHSGFIQNRHDQAIYSALIYKYLNSPVYSNRIKCQWEHIDYFDPLFSQAIRATRLRNGEEEPMIQRIKGSLIRLGKDYILRPIYYGPLQWYYSNK